MFVCVCVCIPVIQRHVKERIYIQLQVFTGAMEELLYNHI